jgi:hypothetical protein
MQTRPSLSVFFAGFLLAATGPAGAQATWTTLPGEFAFKTPKGFYVGALSGGGLVAQPTVVTGATNAADWEKFRISVLDPPPANDKAIQTFTGNYLTAVGGGGRTSDVLHTDATQARAWEQFRIYDLSAGGVAPTYFAVQTINQHYLTAVGQGGKYEDAIHSDANQIKSWEYFRIVKCGDLGTDYQYTIVTNDGTALSAPDGGGSRRNTIVKGPSAGEPVDRSWSRFKLIRQSDGTYALQTANGVNFVTALQGGGLVQKALEPDCGLFEACLGGTTDIFHTDATQVRGWEKFRFVDRGNCKYAIQTTSGFFMGIFRDSKGNSLLTTRRDGVSTPDETFELVMYGLASPPVFH